MEPEPDREARRRRNGEKDDLIARLRREATVRDVELAELRARLDAAEVEGSRTCARSAMPSRRSSCPSVPA
jgi:hypothetical protein